MDERSGPSSAANLHPQHSRANNPGDSPGTRLTT